MLGTTYARQTRKSDGALDTAVLLGRGEERRTEISGADVVDAKRRGSNGIWALSPSKSLAVELAAQAGM